MIQKRFENRATRRNNKKKKNKRFVNLMAISTVTAVIAIKLMVLQIIKK